jgi:hypothetical protein
MLRPNFLVIGAQRAGTTLLHRILAEHPEVYVPRQRKELHYFDRYYERGPNWYAGYFPSEGEAHRFRAIGEVTPDYLPHPQAPARIEATLPGCRLIAILRDPVERAFSWYCYCRRSKNERRPFLRFVEEDPTAFAHGLYDEQLARYFAHIPRHQLQVRLYEDLVSDPKPELAALAAFLHLTRPFTERGAARSERVNTGTEPRFKRAFALARCVGGFLLRHDANGPVRLAKRLGVREWFGRSGEFVTLDDRSRRVLAARYADSVQRLSELLGWDLEAAWLRGTTQPRPLA